MSIEALKKQSNLSSLIDEYNKQTTPETRSFDDERFWKPELDKSGNGYAVIRFLPAPKGEDIPWQRMFSHSFQGPGGWYIENSLTTINKNDPVGEVNRRLWNSGSEADKETARRQKRKLSYYTNIYVVTDTKHPEHEGKVCLYKFGKKIFDKIMESMQPQFDDEEAINPFDLWKGANFKLKIRKVDGYWNYDKSEFEDPSAIFDNDDAIEEVWKKQYSLAEFTASTNFKSYDELKTRMNMVLAGTTRVGSATTLMEDEPVAKPTVDTKPVYDKSERGQTVTTVPADDGDDESLDYFKKLAADG